MPSQASGEEIRVTLPFSSCWLYIGDETSIAKGYLVSTVAGAEKFGLYYFTDATRRFNGPWFGQDLFLRSVTAGTLNLNILAVPLELFGHASPTV
jgi:hypothetical protein